MSAKSMSLYVDKMWIRQEGRYWIAKAVAFSENDNDVTISACHESPGLAYKRLVAGMKSCGWCRRIGTIRQAHRPLPSQNVEEAQKVFHHHARMASAAATGSYSREMEQEQELERAFCCRLFGHRLHPRSPASRQRPVFGPGPRLATAFDVPDE